MHGSGTVVSTLSHILNDLFPYVYCCKGEFPDCAKYYERRPSDDGSRFSPPVPGTSYIVCETVGILFSPLSVLSVIVYLSLLQHVCMEILTS